MSSQETSENKQATHPNRIAQSEYLGKSKAPFRIMKRQFGFRKAIYRGRAENDNKLAMLFALANVFGIDKMI